MTDATVANRERSPRYPSLSLRSALERAAQLKAEHDRHTVRVDSAKDAWGYGSKSGGGRQALATLILYGILQDSGSGSDRKVQLTDTAWRYLVDERPDHRESVLKQLALTPKVMVELFNAWGTKPPGDAECRSQLRLERGFTETAAQELLAIYKDNIAFAKLADSDKVTSEPEAIEPQKEKRGAIDHRLSPPVERMKVMAQERELTTGLLSKDASFRLIVSGQIGVKEIERLIQKLELDKDILAEQAEDETPGETGKTTYKVI